MNFKQNHYLQTEKGNISLFTIGLLSIMIILFIVVLNLSKILAVKEEANKTSQQASLVATSILYEEIWDSVNKYEDTIIGKVDKYPETISEKVDKRTLLLQGQSKYREYTSNEIRLEAIDQVFTEELKNGIGKDDFKDILKADIEYQIFPDMRSAVQDSIRNNDGSLSGAKIGFDDGRIYVKASNNFIATSYDGFLKDFSKKLFQRSTGPKIDFISELNIHLSSSLE